MAGKREGPANGIDLGTDDLMVQCELLFGDGVIHLHLL
uniref:Uncharacterized protein n=1 Tax=Cucumis melo TaxID=3656 RepID=A0A9I9E5M2_CUCME